MPAMSRQMQSGSRRSAMRLCGLALEVDDLPAGGRMQCLSEMEVAVYALRIQGFGTQVVEAAQQPGNVRRQRRGDLGSLMQAIHHDHCRPRTQHLRRGKGSAQGVVGLGERVAECLCLRREA